MNEVGSRLAGGDNAVLVVSVPAALNHESAEPLRACVMRRLPNQDGAAVVLDMSAVEMVSSIGIAALLQVQEFCSDRKAPVILAAIPTRQHGFLRMLKLERKFDIADTVEDALAAIGTGG